LDGLSVNPPLDLCAITVRVINSCIAATVEGTMNLWARRAGTLVIAAVLIPSTAWSQEASSLTDQEKEQFLRRAKIRQNRAISTGINNTRRLTLSDGQITHDAHLNTVDIKKDIYQTPHGMERDYRDCYKFVSVR
jgi:hypothetical protein